MENASGAKKERLLRNYDIVCQRLENYNINENKEEGLTSSSEESYDGNTGHADARNFNNFKNQWREKVSV